MVHVALRKMKSIPPAEQVRKEYSLNSAEKMREEQEKEQLLRKTTKDNLYHRISDLIRERVSNPILSIPREFCLTVFLTNEEHREEIQEIIGELKELGYTVELRSGYSPTTLTIR